MNSLSSPETPKGLECDTTSHEFNVEGGNVPITEYISRNPESKVDGVCCVVLTGFKQMNLDDPIPAIASVCANKFGKSVIVGETVIEGTKSPLEFVVNRHLAMLMAINNIVDKTQAREIILVGFSLGGSLALSLARGFPPTKLKASLKSIISLGAPKRPHWLNLPYFQSKSEFDFESGYYIVGNRGLRVPLFEAMDVSRFDPKKIINRLTKSGGNIHSVRMRGDRVVPRKDSVTDGINSMLTPRLKTYLISGDIDGLSPSDIHSWRGTERNRQLLVDVLGKILDNERKEIKV